MDPKSRAPKLKSVLNIGRFSPKNDFLWDLTEYFLWGMFTMSYCEQWYQFLGMSWNISYLKYCSTWKKVFSFSRKMPSDLFILIIHFGTKNNNILQLGTMLNNEGIVLKSFFQIFSIVGR
jgi:hypothetical protein